VNMADAMPATINTNASGMSPGQYAVEMLLQWARQKPDSVWLIQPVQGQIRTYTWAQAAERVAGMAAALKAQNWAPGSCVAISGLNTAHWILADLAIQMAGLVPVGLYPKQAARHTSYILDHCAAKAVFLGPMEDGPAFLQALPAGILRISLPYPDAPRGDQTWDQFVAGHAPLPHYERPAPEALAFLVYTSGTTGNPKGVMLSFGNLAFIAQVYLKAMPSPGGERMFSYLPLAHALERAAVEIASLYWGAEIYFLEKFDQLARQLPIAAPTRFFAVPLVWSRLHAGVTARIPEAKLRRLLRIPLLGRVLRYRLAKRIGLHRTRTVFSGAAPIPRATLDFIRDGFGLDILECYGQSEALYCSMNLPGATRLGSVGKPFADAGFRLSEEGEIQLRHPGVMLGYYKDAEKTQEAFTADGWLRTGDKGRLDADGYLYITGRVKDIFKTAKAKYVAPAPIEGALAKNTDIDQLCLVGMNLTQPIMVVSLTAEARGKPRAQLEQQLLADMREVNVPLEDHEKIAKLLLVRDGWSIENGFLTPTMKVRRNIVEERYAELIACEALKRDTAVAWQ